MSEGGVIERAAISFSSMEDLAIGCARGNNGGEWGSHYTEEQKEFWRGFAQALYDKVKQDILVRLLDDAFGPKT